MKTIAFTLSLMACISSAFAQDTIVIFTQYQLKSGEVYTGVEQKQTDSTYHIQEFNIGEVSLRKKEVLRTVPFYHNQYVKLTLVDASVYRGNLVSADASHIEIDMELAGKVRLERNVITHIAPTLTKKLEVRNPNSTRYFFAPSAIPLEKKSGYYQNAYLLVNSANFGVTNNFSLGGGIVIPLLFYATPKVAYKIGRRQYVGAGLIAGSTFIPNAIISGGIPYVLYTHGTPETNFTLGLGWGMLWNNGKYYGTDYPIISANGLIRFSNKFSLVAENWIVPYTATEIEYVYDPVTFVTTEVKTNYESAFVACAMGTRILVGERASLDFAPLFVHTGQPKTNGIVVPYIDFVFRF